MNGSQKIKECRERMASYTPEQRQHVWDMVERNLGRKLKNVQFESEDRRPIPAFEPTILFDEETANSIDWKQYYPY